MSNTPKSDSEDWTEWEVLSVQSHAVKSQKSPKITSQKINIDKTTSSSSNSSNESFSQVQISNNNNINNNKNNNNNNNNNNNPNYNGNMYTCPSNLMTSQLVSNHDDEKQSVLWMDNNKQVQQPQQQQIPSLHMPQQQPQRQQQYYHPNNMNINPYMNMNNNLGLYQQQQQQLVQQQQQQMVQQQQLSQLTPPKIPIQIPQQPLVQVQMPSQPQPQQGGLFWPFNYNYHPQVPPPQVQVQQVPLQPMQTSPLVSNDNNNNINKKKEDIISPLLSLNALDLNIKPDTTNKKNNNNNNNNNKKKEEEPLEQDIDNNNVWKCNNCNCYHDESHRFCPSCGIKNSLLDNIKQDNNNNNKDKENEFNIVFKQIISGINYDPNEKRQCGWILTSNHNNKINGIAKLNYIGGNDEIKIEHESFYDIHLNKNEDLYILIDVIAPSIVGKYTCFYQLILDNGMNFGPILELNVNVQKQFDDKKESKIEQIIKMGFNNRQQVIHCLQKHKWVVDHALNELLGQ